MDICGSVEYNEHEIRITKLMNGYFSDTARLIVNKGNNKITELRTILQRESQNS
jgi:hypothetical protein